MIATFVSTNKSMKSARSSRMVKIDPPEVLQQPLNLVLFSATPAGRRSSVR
jgi:hypothetical protein